MLINKYFSKYLNTNNTVSNINTINTINNTDTNNNINTISNYNTINVDTNSNLDEEIYHTLTKPSNNSINNNNNNNNNKFEKNQSVRHKFLKPLSPIKVRIKLNPNNKNQNPIHIHNHNNDKLTELPLLNKYIETSSNTSLKYINPKHITNKSEITYDSIDYFNRNNTVSNINTNNNANHINNFNTGASNINKTIIIHNNTNSDIINNSSSNIQNTIVSINKIKNQKNNVLLKSKLHNDHNYEKFPINFNNVILAKKTLVKDNNTNYINNKSIRDLNNINFRDLSKMYNNTEHGGHSNIHIHGNEHDNSFEKFSEQYNEIKKNSLNKINILDLNNNQLNNVMQKFAMLGPTYTKSNKTNNNANNKFTKKKTDKIIINTKDNDKDYKENMITKFKIKFNNIKTQKSVKVIT